MKQINKWIKRQGVLHSHFYNNPSIKMIVAFDIQLKKWVVRNWKGWQCGLSFNALGTALSFAEACYKGEVI